MWDSLMLAPIMFCVTTVNWFCELTACVCVCSPVCGYTCMCFSSHSCVRGLGLSVHAVYLWFYQ